MNLTGSSGSYARAGVAGDTRDPGGPLALVPIIREFDPGRDESKYIRGRTWVCGL